MICSHALVGAAGQTAPTNHLEPPLQKVYVVVQVTAPNKIMMPYYYNPFQNILHFVFIYGSTSAPDVRTPTSIRIERPRLFRPVRSYLCAARASFVSRACIRITAPDPVHQRPHGHQRRHSALATWNTRMQHTFETDETFGTYDCNMCVKHMQHREKK